MRETCPRTRNRNTCDVLSNELFTSLSCSPSELRVPVWILSINYLPNTDECANLNNQDKHYVTTATRSFDFYLWALLTPLFLRRPYHDQSLKLFILMVHPHCLRCELQLLQGSSMCKYSAWAKKHQCETALLMPLPMGTHVTLY